MEVCGNEECSPTDATGAATGLHPVTLHALHQPQGSVSHCILFLSGDLLIVIHQLVYKAVDVQTGINRPAQHVMDVLPQAQLTMKARAILLICC